eukprot:6983787-Pyramimonas_sp.AAC.1
MSDLQSGQLSVLSQFVDEWTKTVTNGAIGCGQASWGPRGLEFRAFQGHGPGSGRKGPKKPT